MHYHDVESLRRRGVELPDPSAVHVETRVPLEGIGPGVILHPGTRIEGEKTVLAAGVEIGREGPAVVVDSAFGAKAALASGSVRDAVLLAGASLGPDSHVRAGSLLEEGASTGHAVGLKQTLLLAFATLGSNVNFCDCLMSGGRSRKDHSEVGSGFIHFNFTPFGDQGDKATASLFGDVPRGVTLREDRVFLGGAGGVVGPVTIGFGSVLAAGSVYRKSYGDHRLVYSEALPPRQVDFDPLLVRGAARRFEATCHYIGELRALQRWYNGVRLARARDEAEVLVLERAQALLDGAVKERIKQGDRLASNLQTALSRRPGAYGDEARLKEEAALANWTECREGLSAEAPALEIPAALKADLSRVPDADHIAWLADMEEAVAREATAWLQSIVEAIAPR